MDDICLSPFSLLFAFEYTNFNTQKIYLKEKRDSDMEEMLELSDWEF